MLRRGCGIPYCYGRSLRVVHGLLYARMGVYRSEALPRSQYVHTASPPCLQSQHIVRRFQEWLLERYHPKMIQQKKEDKIKWVAQESAAFALQLRANPVAFIASAALDPISEVCYFSVGV